MTAFLVKFGIAIVFIIFLIAIVLVVYSILMIIDWSCEFSSVKSKEKVKIIFKSVVLILMTFFAFVASGVVLDLSEKAVIRMISPYNDTQIEKITTLGAITTMELRQFLEEDHDHRSTDMMLWAINPKLSYETCKEYAKIIDSIKEDE